VPKLIVPVCPFVSTTYFPKLVIVALEQNCRIGAKYAAGSEHTTLWLAVSISWEKNRFHTIFLRNYGLITSHFHIRFA
jgi:hypothetical protein